MSDKAQSGFEERETRGVKMHQDIQPHFKMLDDQSLKLYEEETLNYEKCSQCFFVTWQKVNDEFHTPVATWSGVQRSGRKAFYDNV